jgi:AraC-like DNA-binding protein
MICQLKPSPALQPYASLLWASELGVHAQAHAPAPLREHVLPTGQMHVIFRLSEQPLKLFDSPQDDRGRTVGSAIVGGARDAFYIKDISQPSASVGCVLRPGAAMALLGVAAHEISGVHTRLEDLWGAFASAVQSQLIEAKSACERLRILEQALLARLQMRRNSRTSAMLLPATWDIAAPVAQWVQASGLSHRHFNAQFLSAVGLAPKRYARVQRMQKALKLIKANSIETSTVGASGIAIALDGGFSDQAHFCREFQAFCGMTLTQYMAQSPAQINHVAVPVR